MTYWCFNCGVTDNVEYDEVAERILKCSDCGCFVKEIEDGVKT